MLPHTGLFLLGKVALQMRIRCRLKNGLGYDEKRDIEFFDCEPETWLTLQPGEFALFFPNDAHAPLVGGEKSIRKAVFKIRVAE